MRAKEQWSMSTNWLEAQTHSKTLETELRAKAEVGPQWESQRTSLGERKKERVKRRRRSRRRGRGRSGQHHRVCKQAVCVSIG